MEIRILGPVGIWRGEQAIAVVGPKQRTLLALLVLRANQVVSHDRLVSALWGTKIPPTGRRLLHNHLWSVRRLLSDGEALVGTPTGYTLRLPPGASDLDVFTTETAAARRALSGENFVEAAERFRTALALWRGPALGGTDPELQATEGVALTELRTAALIGRIEADLACGRHSELIGELRLLIAEHSLNEELRGQLMRALHRVGRTAEALEEFQKARRHFHEELGLDLGRELTEIHRTILTREDATASTPAPAVPDRRVPRQLPPAITRFTGRSQALRELDGLLPAQGGTAMLVSAVSGAAGIGKTALVTHWGHNVSDRFPDGQLYVDLHGYSSERMIGASQALNRLLRGLGADEEEIPHSLDERAALYRSLLADRRMLVVLDNAATAEQVRPLLPGASPSRVVITSRDALRSLSVTHDIRCVMLDVLSTEEAVALLNDLLGTDRTVHDTDVITELAHLCGRLPLALRLAGAQLGGGSASRVRDFVARLRRENRLTVLELAEDPSVGVRSALELSYRALPEPARRMFRLIGVHPGPSLGTDAAAVLADMSVEEASDAIETLVNAHLLQRNAERRLSMHDLVRVYAEERAADDEPPEEHDAALTRTLDWYRYSAFKAMEHLMPLGGPAFTVLPVERAPEFPGSDEAGAWLGKEQPTLIALMIHAAAVGRHAHTWQMFTRLSWFFYSRNCLDDLFLTGEIALSSARLSGARDGEAGILSDLGYAKVFVGRYAEHLACQQEALEIWRTLNDRTREAEALRHVSYALHLSGQPLRAIEIGEQALVLERELGNRAGEISMMDHLALSYFVLDRFDETVKVLVECRKYWRETGREYNELYCLIQLGMAHTELGEMNTALECFQQASLLNRHQGNQHAEIETLSGIASALRRQERYEEAFEHHEKALALARSTRSRPKEAEALIGLASTCLASGNLRIALLHYQEVLNAFDDVDEVYFQGAAHEGVGDALHALGRSEEAVKPWKAAFDIWERMGAPKSEKLRERMREAGLN
ncbi:AfsR/SARP family transcriptional regulator [Streptosporangium saharense]|uniref:AfsR/SARP family transcriptional regulator n=1 Tax=Streptosporangium saharense TaxID=1706840 RepID=UPI0036D1D419